MLSFGYTLLAQEAVAALEGAGLDAAVGFLHRARWGRPSLALDLMEEFRPMVVDAMVLRCLSAGIVRFEEFETTPDLGCRMNARARQAFLAAYERRMLTVLTHEPTGRRVSLRRLIDPVEDQVRLYPLDDQAARRVTVIGARTIEERQDFWIVT